MIATPLTNKAFRSLKCGLSRGILDRYSPFPCKPPNYLLNTDSYLVVLLEFQSIFKNGSFQTFLILSLVASIKITGYILMETSWHTGVGNGSPSKGTKSFATALSWVGKTKKSPSTCSPSQDSVNRQDLLCHYFKKQCHFVKRTSLNLSFLTWSNTSLVLPKKVLYELMKSGLCCLAH